METGRPTTTPMPFPGDFVVVSMNPLLSVAHLDSLAREEAAALQTGKYVALVTHLVSGHLIGQTKYILIYRL